MFQCKAMLLTEQAEHTDYEQSYFHKTGFKNFFRLFYALLGESLILGSQIYF